MLDVPSVLPALARWTICLRDPVLFPQHDVDFFGDFLAVEDALFSSFVEKVLPFSRC